MKLTAQRLRTSTRVPDARLVRDWLRKKRRCRAVAAVLVASGGVPVFLGFAVAAFQRMPPQHAGWSPEAKERAVLRDWPYRLAWFVQSAIMFVAAAVYVLIAPVVRGRLKVVRSSAANSGVLVRLAVACGVCFLTFCYRGVINVLGDVVLAVHVALAHPAAYVWSFVFEEIFPSLALMYAVAPIVIHAVDPQDIEAALRGPPTLSSVIVPSGVSAASTQASSLRTSTSSVRGLRSPLLAL